MRQETRAADWATAEVLTDGRRSGRVWRGSSWGLRRFAASIPPRPGLPHGAIATGGREAAARLAVLRIDHRSALCRTRCQTIAASCSADHSLPWTRRPTPPSRRSTRKPSRGRAERRTASEQHFVVLTSASVAVEQWPSVCLIPRQSVDHLRVLRSDRKRKCSAPEYFLPDQTVTNSGTFEGEGRPSARSAGLPGSTSSSTSPRSGWCGGCWWRSGVRLRRCGPK